MKVSYCTTCKGRLSFVAETLPRNLEAESGNPDVEFVILDYDSADGLREWLYGTYGDLIQTGRIRYARFAPAPTFRMAHAKNMAHLAASGDILCSVDADNLIAKDTSLWLRKTFAAMPDFIASPRILSLPGFVQQRWLNRFIGRATPTSGICGRVAVSRANFLRLGGYDETMSAWGGDDIEFMLKARDNGLTCLTLPEPFWGRAIEHSNDLRLEHMSGRDRAVSRTRLGVSAIQQLKNRASQFSKTGREPSDIAAPPNLEVFGAI